MDKDKVQLFREFLRSHKFKDVLHSFHDLCESCNVVNPRDAFKIFKEKINSNEAKNLWRYLDTRWAQDPYKVHPAGANYKVVIIGAGPCGLRMAIEAAFLGCQVHVLEMREDFSRNNVLHLWPFVIHDLKSVGAKVVFPKFCSGNREHISIQRLQSILLKIVLILGVNVHIPVEFKDVIEPDSDQTGYKVKVSPTGHSLENMKFDAIISADGKKNTLKVFRRKMLRGRVALGVTANFENLNQKLDNTVEEFGGLFKGFNQPFFEKLKKQGGIDLENFVYFKNETHYTVMTATKKSLLERDVFKTDKDTTTDLLSWSNINAQNLAKYARDAIDIATDGALADRDFAKNSRGEKDVAVFDFTALWKAEYSCLFAELNGQSLMMALVGDSLIEPFWPTGSGIAKGFLSVWDTSWLLRSMIMGQKSKLRMIAEREGIFSALSQVTPHLMQRNLTKYNIDPKTRYGSGLKITPLNENQVRHLYHTKSLTELIKLSSSFDQENNKNIANVPRVSLNALSLRESMMNSTGTSISYEVLHWYQKELENFKDVVKIEDLGKSWNNGNAFCAIISHYRPDLMNIRMLISKTTTVMKKLKMAFDIIEDIYEVSPNIRPYDLAGNPNPDVMPLLTYLTKLRLALMKERTLCDNNAGIKRPLAQQNILRNKNEFNKEKKFDENVLKKPSRMSTLDKITADQLAKKRINAWEKGVKETSEPDKELQNSSNIYDNAVCDATKKGVSKFVRSLDEIDEDSYETITPTDDEIDEDSYENLPLTDELNLDSLVNANESYNTPENSSNMTAWLGAFMMTSEQTLGMNDMKTMEENNPLIAVGEELVDSSSSENEEDENDYMDMDSLYDDDTSLYGTLTRGGTLSRGGTLPRTKTFYSDTGKQTLRKKTTVYSLVASLQLHYGNVLQEELSKTEEQQKEIEEGGKHLEKIIRQRESENPEEEDEEKERLIDQFINLNDRKQENEARQKKLQLKAKLFENQKRLQVLQREMADIEVQLDTPTTRNYRDEEAIIDSLSAQITYLEKSTNDMKISLKEVDESYA